MKKNKNNITIGLVCLTMLMSVLTGVFAAPADKVDIQVKPGHETRIVFYTQTWEALKSFTLENPNRLIIDFKSTKAGDPRKNYQLLALSGLKTPIQNTPIKAVRSHFQDGVLRVVFDLEHLVKYTSTVLGEGDGYRYRLAIQWPNLQDTIMSQLPAKASPSSAQSSQDELEKLVQAVQMKKENVNDDPPYSPPSASASPVGRGEETEQPIYLSQRERAHRPVVIAIDAGHGGTDPGAIGLFGTREKDVVLAIAYRLKALIDQRPGMRAVLTRYGDYLIPLRLRPRMARKEKADLFVSIHADAYKNRTAQGASVFALSLRGASSEAARWLAEKENYSVLGGVPLTDKGDILRSVLIDLSQTSTIASSLDAGESILGHLSRFSKLHTNRVEQARFAVLTSPDIPSILVETGFISTPHEEALLRSPEYQHQLAQAILDGIHGFFIRKPPSGTLFAVMRQQSTSTGRM